MSTKNAPQDETAIPVTATMLFGRYWAVGDIVFNRDTGALTHPVNAETEAQLREHGFEVIHVNGQEFRKPRFAFSNDAPGAEQMVRIGSAVPQPTNSNRWG